MLRTPIAIRATFATLAAGLLAAGLAPSSAAHDSAVAVGAKGLQVRASVDADARFVRFRTEGQTPIGLDHDPRIVPTWIMVRGNGPSGGGTGRIALPAEHWSPVMRRGELRAYRYRDRSGSQGGVDRAVLSEGGLSFRARGAGWTWQPAGEQTEVWVYLGIEEETFCARFGGNAKTNRAGEFKAGRVPSPGACPDAICGNGVHEFGEECDDGNLVEDDGCTLACVQTECSGESFDSTFAALQSRLFDDAGCGFAYCHGTGAPQAGLQLTSEVAYDNLIDVPAQGSSLVRVVPGEPRDSALYLKLLKGFDPETDIPGQAMPIGGAITPGMLEAVRLWIDNGAPETGTVEGTQALLASCLPEPGPIEIAPLAPPDTSLGAQIVMPPYTLPAESESEICFATYYDLSDVIPEEFKDPSGDFFFIKNHTERHDPHSHHLTIVHSGLGPESASHPSFGTWTCIGGASDGSICNPIAPGACGEGICRSTPGPNVACINYGPPGAGNASDASTSFVGPQTDEPGFFRRQPVRGLLYWNTHAFNLTSQDHEMHAWLNVEYADDRQQETIGFQNANFIWDQAGAPPYEKFTLCRPHTFGRGTRLLTLAAHTHRRGEEFWVNDPSGERIYENFTYADPVVESYDPPLSFDSFSAAQRTIEFCATYNNGVRPDGSPDPTTVRRRSTTPSNGGQCTPVACAEGRVGAPCSGVFDHATCDTAPGAGDGMCDACPLTGWISTEDEMFVLLGSFYVE